MSQYAEFAALVRQRYPEGLTAIIPIGGTRTTYILERNREQPDPGRIDMRAYADDTAARIMNLMRIYFELGGQNLVAPILSYQLFEDVRGEEYSIFSAKMSHRLLKDEWVRFYREMEIDPYFGGIDTLLNIPSRTHTYELGVACTEFQQNWDYRAGRRKLIWEIAPIPLFSFWRAPRVMGEAAERQLEADLAAAPNMNVMHDLLYRFYTKAVYGTELPYPHFYLGSNRSGDLKLRAMLPIAMLCGGAFRLFYTPYSVMLLTQPVLQAVIEDVAFGKRRNSNHIDYSGTLSPDVVELEYSQILALRDDPEAVVGRLNRAEKDD